MIGGVAPLKALQELNTQKKIIERILHEYPRRKIAPGDPFYRIRKSPSDPTKPLQYDNPPENILSTGRLDSPVLPAIYASHQIDLCVHERRVTSEGELDAAKLSHNAALNVLCISVLLKQGDNVTEFESIYMAVHMLFLA